MAGLLNMRRPTSPMIRSPRRWVSPFQELEDMFERFWGDPPDGLGTQLIAPPLDMTESEGEILLRMDLPGINIKDIDIQLNGNQLTVSGERKDEEEISSQTYHRVERRCGRFARSILLPCEVQDENVDARYVDGVLSIKLPKTAEAKARHIQVKA